MQIHIYVKVNLCPMQIEIKYMQANLDILVLLLLYLFLGYSEKNYSDAA